MFTELGMLGGGQNSAAPLQRAAMESRWRPNTEAAPNCPRCDSTNTKFCYYNNYSLSQPRYFCKSCRRYWTKGGSLRSVPVGGGCRKNRRGKAAMRVSNHPDPNSTDSTCLSSSDNSTPSTEQGQRDGGSGCSMPSEIDLALVYEKYISQPPDDDHQSIRLDQSQTAFSQINSGGLLPELAGQFAMEFEAEIAQTMPEFDVIPNCNEVSYQWQAFCDNDTTKDLHGSELNERRGEELYGFAGFRRDLGNQDIANPQSIRSSNWQHQGLEVTRAPADDFVFCPDFSQNSSCFADNFQSFESLYHYHI